MLYEIFSLMLAERGVYGAYALFVKSSDLRGKSDSVKEEAGAGGFDPVALKIALIDYLIPHSRFLIAEF